VSASEAEADGMIEFEAEILRRLIRDSKSGRIILNRSNKAMVERVSNLGPDEHPSVKDGRHLFALARKWCYIKLEPKDSLLSRKRRNWALKEDTRGE